MFTPWIIAAVVALILLKAAFGHKEGAVEARTFEGTTWHGSQAHLFAIAALAFIVLAVILYSK